MEAKITQTNRKHIQKWKIQFPAPCGNNCLQIIIMEVPCQKNAYIWSICSLWWKCWMLWAILVQHGPRSAQEIDFVICWLYFSLVDVWFCFGNCFKWLISVLSSLFWSGWSVLNFIRSGKSQQSEKSVNNPTKSLDNTKILTIWRILSIPQKSYQSKYNKRLDFMGHIGSIWAHTGYIGSI